MKKRTNRVLSMFISVILLIGICLSGCGGGYGIALFGEKEANFLLVREFNASNTVKDAIKSLKDEIKENIGVTVNYKPDSVEYNADVMEVNIGLTNRTHAKSIYDELVEANTNNVFDYTIRFVDNVVYIVGLSDDALLDAIEYFKDKFCQKQSSNIQVDYRYDYHFKDITNFSIAGNKDLSNYSIVTPKYNMSYLIGREVANLQEELKTSTATIVPEVMDNHEETQYEIVIGNSKREGTPEITDKDEYCIKTSGDKLYISGGSDEAIAIAVKEVIRMVEKGTAIKKDADIRGSYKKTVKNYEDYYSLTWADEFEELNEDVWVPLGGTFTHFGEPAKELFMTSDEESLYVKDGKLHLHASQDDRFYKSVEVRTPGVRFKYGFIECSSKFNISAGIASAFWLLADSTSTYHSELDIFESQGAPNNKVVVTPISHARNGEQTPLVDYCGAITGDRFVNAAYTLDEGETFNDEFHTFGLEWDEKSITFTLDGRAFITMDITKDERSKETYDDYVQILFSHYSGVEIGLTTGQPDETTDWDNNALVADYVRLYQMPGQELEIR